MTLVELLVVIVLLGVIAGATFTVVLSAIRAQRFTEQAQDATNDARLSIERIRQQLRTARLVTQPSNARSIRFWVDSDQDGLLGAGEVLCFHAAAVAGVPDRYELKRWVDATSNCNNFAPPANARVIARTLRNIDIFQYSTATAGFTAISPSTIGNNPPVRRVDVKLVFDVNTSSGPAPFLVNTKVRLRNVA